MEGKGSRGLSCPHLQPPTSLLLCGAGWGVVFDEQLLQWARDGLPNKSQAFGTPGPDSSLPWNATRHAELTPQREVCSPK